MAQADGVVANGTGSAVRSDINNQYAALWSNHSGSTEPSSGIVSYQFWADTNANILKIRNPANNAWINLFTTAGGVDVDAASNFNEDVTFVGASSKNAVWDKSDGALEFADNAKCTFGNNDLSIYHDASDSYITNTTGELIITDAGLIRLKTDDLRVYKGNGTELMFRAEADGACGLRYDNSVKFVTQSNGALMEGNAGGLEFKTTSGNSNNFIKFSDHDTADAARFNYEHSTGEFLFKTSSSWRMRLGSTYLKPETDDAVDLGTSSQRYDDIYATSGSVNQSDRNSKNTIVDSDLGLSFINKLKPVSYIFNGKTRKHYGLIAQDIETVLSDISKPTSDFAGFVKEDISDVYYTNIDVLPDGKNIGDLKKAAYTTYGLRYSEFISPLIKAVQELSVEVETLKTKVAALETK